MGRLTDFMSAFLVDQAVALRALGKNEAAARAQHMVDHCRENDLQVTHALIDPQTDRSTLDAPSQAVQVVERRAPRVRGRRGPPRSTPPPRPQTGPPRPPHSPPARARESRRALLRAVGD